MSFYDAFRGFFGFPGRGRPRDPLLGSSAWDGDAEDEEEGGGEGPSLAWPPRDFTFGFGFGPGGSRGAFEELLRDVGEFLGGWSPPQPLEPHLPGPAERPLRDSMLKQPEAAPGGPEGPSDPTGPWRPFLGLPDPPLAPPALKEDQDLDSQVSSAGLGTILRPKEPPSRLFFQSVSVTRVTLPDGAVEERRTVQDSRGRRETTVTRRRGEQEPLSAGDGELPQFPGSWPWQDELRAPNLGDPSSALGGFFRRWFSSW
ncbi:HCLS1-associated protein X-1 [Pterocles gutturalis]